MNSNRQQHNSSILEKFPDHVKDSALFIISNSNLWEIEDKWQGATAWSGGHRLYFYRGWIIPQDLIETLLESGYTEEEAVEEGFKILTI